ncbi:DMT family transporter [Variovorax sp. NFACC27]|uniref:DMT family transporter n=1 Tax=unclassified Variovorax TaxID=663243 RepID=UPI0008990AEB|nr:DMT family transporter [Variovorax sp. YR750]MDP9604452.1 drug/metabolite transporter (DMT)-like permease [Variovorax paradoxus]SEF20156.1 EamA-like transporter family protein [Variovorax sp. NFACC28]SEF62437.1 EamA-like transporter family protein [Variovorax sp. NFACC29]SFB73153.1 EamA-like transporter family protein [Variovorax sp. NFACC26]SFG56128.1 EamA-like transporter family protein [Variovorax sp. NFACC27]
MWQYAFPLLAVVIWSGNTVVSKMAAGTIAPTEISFYRWLLAAVLFTPLALRPVLRNWRAVRPQLGRIAVLGLLGMVAYQSLAYYAAYLTTATHMGIIGSLTPMMVLALSILLLGQRLTAGAVAGSLVSIAGVAVVVSSGDLGTLLKSGANMGDGLMLLAMLAYAVYVILLKRWGMKEVPALQLLYLQIVFTVIALLPMYLLMPKMGLSAANLPLVGFAGLGASMLAPLMWMHTVAHIGPSRASMFFNLIPLFTVMIAAVVIGESLAAYHAVGGVLTVAGVLLAELWKAPLRQRRALAG